MSIEKKVHEITLSNKDKVLFPKAKITKGELIAYYERIADFILPHLHDRPINMQRFPNGISKSGFYQKDRPDYFPEWIDAVVVKKEGGTVNQVICNDKATLVYLANQACITPHTWLCRKDNLYHPDKLIFDLDPPDGKFDLVIKGARAMRHYLEEELALPVYLMTTGSKGVHVAISLLPEKPFDEVRGFAKKLSQYIASLYPDHFTTEIRKEKRKGRLFLDYLRNGYGQTGVTPYSVRARENAPVATPLRWDELNPRLNAQSYNIKNIFRRLGNMDDPWTDFFGQAHSLEIPFKKMNELLEGK